MHSQLAPDLAKHDGNAAKKDRTERFTLGCFRDLLASQSIPSWNQIIAWLNEMETLRVVIAA